jgi:hypothetical protein
MWGRWYLILHLFYYNCFLTFPYFDSAKLLGNLHEKLGKPYTKRILITRLLKLFLQLSSFLEKTIMWKTNLMYFAPFLIGIKYISSAQRYTQLVSMVNSLHLCVKYKLQVHIFSHFNLVLWPQKTLSAWLECEMVKNISFSMAGICCITKVSFSIV